MLRVHKRMIKEEMASAADIIENAADVFKKAVSEMTVTTVKHKGKVRKWKGSIEQWEKHSDVIKGWCDGADVETFHYILDEWFSAINPQFYITAQYRIAKPTPQKHGAIYSDDDCGIYIHDDNVGKIKIPSTHYSEPNKYLAPSTAAYHARLFLERCDGKTDQETVAYLAEQCKYGD